MLNRNIFSALVLMLTAGMLHGQFTYDYLRAADQYFAKGDHYSAAQYYEKYLGVGDKKKMATPGYNPYTVQTGGKKGGVKQAALSSREQAVYNLAECYRLLNYPAKAEPAYKETTGFNKTRFPLAGFHYGTVLRALKKFDEAEAAFSSFAAAYTQKDHWSEAAEREIRNLRFIQQQMQRKDLGLYAVNRLDAVTANPGGANYAPVWLNGQTILFTSTRNDSTAAEKNRTDNRLYQAAWSNGALSMAQKAGIAQTPEFQQGVAAMSPDGKKLYITRWTSDNGKKTADIFMSRQENGGWGQPVKVEGLGAEGFSSQQPFVMPNGKQLIFASNRAGGLGGYDLYMAELDGNGAAKSVTNMGDVMNTPGDEQAPYYHAASEALVFSSNGRTGMGGFDFYHSKMSEGRFTEPVNFGHPVNSVKDDIYFTSRGSARNILEDVLFSSDRDAACCLELFYLKKDKPLRNISGLVLSCDNGKPLADATVQILDTVNNKVVRTEKTGADGTYSFVLEDYQPLKAVASSAGFVEQSIHFNSPADEMAVTLRNPDMCLDKVFPPPPGVVEELENIYFEYEKYDLLEASFPTLDKLAKNMLEHPEVKIELAGHTDGNGTEDFNLKLSQNRAQACVNYLISKGVKPEQLAPKGYGESKPIAPNTNDDGSDNPEGRAKNRRTEFKVIMKE